MDRLRSIEVFVRVVELGSFSRAAESLRMAPASVTTAVQQLEAQLQVRLLQRTTRRVAATPDGAAYYEEAARILRELGELESTLGRSARSPSGTLRVDVPASAGRHLIAPALPSFLAAHPGLTVELGSSDRPVDLLGEGVDCVVRGGDVHDESLVARRLGELPVITCAAPAYLAERGTPAHPDELASHRFVNFFSAKTGRIFDVELARGADVREFRAAHRVAANDADTWIALAVAGLGLVQAPVSPAVRAHVAAGALVRVLPDWHVEGLPLYALYPRNRHLTARVRVFLDWISALYAEECAAARRFVDGG